MSSLYQRNINPAAYLAHALYYVYEAKKYAENVGGVGDKTDLFLIRPDGHKKAMPGNLGALEAVWNQVKPKEVDVSMLQGAMEGISELPKRK